MHTDDGIVLRLPGDRGGTRARTWRCSSRTRSRRSSRPSSAARRCSPSRFRECAARALLLPKRNPGRRAPLWQQRQRSAQLLVVAGQYGSFPVDARDDARVPAGRLRRPRPGRADARRRQPDGPDRRGRDAAALAVRAEPGVRLHRAVHVRGRPAARRAPGRGARARLRAARGAARHGRAARAARPGCRSRRSRPSWPGSPTQRRLQRRRGRRRRAAGARRPVGPTSWCAGARRPRCWPGSSSERGARSGSRIARRGALDRDRGREPGPRRARHAAAGGRPAGVPRVGERPARRICVSRFAPPARPVRRARTSPARFGLGIAVVEQALHRLGSTGQLVQGEFRPGGVGKEWCDADVLRSLRRRSMAKLRQEVEPAPPRHAGSVPAGLAGRRRCMPGAASTRCFEPIEQLAGAVGAGLDARDDHPAEPGRGLHPVDARRADRRRRGAVGRSWRRCRATTAGSRCTWPTPRRCCCPPLDDELALTPLHQRLARRARGRRRVVLPQRWPTGSGPTDDKALAARDVGPGVVGTADQRHARRRCARCSAVGAGHGRGSPPAAVGLARHARPATGRRASPGRWSLVRERRPEPTRRAHAAAEALLERHGIVTRGAVVAEHVPGGFAAVYRVLKAFEETGRCRRGYFVEGLGGAQFALPGAVDRMRVDEPIRPATRATTTPASVLAATDPANPYGAALAWPDHDGTHRPGRKAGALVVLVDGDLLPVRRARRQVAAVVERRPGPDPARRRRARARRAGRHARSTRGRARRRRGGRALPARRRRWSRRASIRRRAGCGCVPDGVNRA